MECAILPTLHTPPIYNCGSSWKEFLLLAHCWSSQKRIDQTTADTKIPEDRVARVFAALRDLSAWYVCESTRSIIFADGEVGMDAKMTHDDREGPES